MPENILPKRLKVAIFNDFKGTLLKKTVNIQIGPKLNFRQQYVFPCSYQSCFPVFSFNAETEEKFEWGEIGNFSKIFPLSIRVFMYKDIFTQIQIFSCLCIWALNT
jgi:hypothetical protein